MRLEDPTAVLRQRPRAGDPRTRLPAALAAHGSRTALVGSSVPGGAITYADLASRVEDARDRLGAERRLVLVPGERSLDAVVAYLGALAGAHPVLLAGPDQAAALSEHYDVDVVASGPRLLERRTGTAHELHPDLALLLTTSGTTGAPRLVRLSSTNLLSNATAIAEALSLRPDDLAPTTLPLHYCYGLSVLHSHLLVGAGVLLTERSVVTPCFWDELAREGATSLAGVPHTFDLLDRSGFAARDLPSLRYVTQAGGRMPPDDVRRWAELGRTRGFDFVVMYGQTEATARMAYLPADRALEAPASIGMPIPGGRLDLEPVEDADGGLAPDVGELVYSGPNVMLGYAESAADLALGRCTDRLRTGDLARQRPDGLFEIVGRRSRVAKVFGLRIDLDRAEVVLAAHGIRAAAADGGDRLVLAVVADAGDAGDAGNAERAGRVAAHELGLPPAGVRVLELPELPRLASGKVDYRALAARAAPTGDDQHHAPAREVSAHEVAATYARLLGRPAGVEDSFVDLGGDSLSYVECSLQLEELLGHLPDAWHTRSARELASSEPTRRRPTRVRAGEGRWRWRRRRSSVPVETNLLLRAFAIVSIVGTHANLFTMLGGAHLLLGIVGFNFGRFQLNGDAGLPRLGRMLRSVARIAVPSAIVIGVVSLFVDGLGWRQILLVNALTTSDWSEPGWHYWFIEALVTILVVMALLTTLPWVAALERRQPFALPFGLAVAGLLTRYGVVSLGGEDEIHRAHVIFWLFALGWATARATRLRHRVVLTALLVASVPGFFSGFERNAYVVVGMLLLVWVGQVRIPRSLAPLCGQLAGASLWIYLVHWQVYPWLEYRIPLLATVLSLAAGILAWRAWEAAGARLAAGPRTGTESPSPGGPVDRARIDTAGGGPGLVRTRESGR